MKTELLKLKTELKALANIIKAVKPNLRQDQSDFDKKYPQRNNYEQYKILSKDEEFNTQQKEVWNNYSIFGNAYQEFRAKHIAYCLLRGRTIEQIEPKLRDPNSYIHTKVRKEADKIVASVLAQQNAPQQPVVEIIEESLWNKVTNFLS